MRDAYSRLQPVQVVLPGCIVLILPVIGVGPVVERAAADDGHDVQIEIEDVDPAQDDKPRIVDQQREVLLALTRRQEDYAPGIDDP